MIKYLFIVKNQSFDSGRHRTAFSTDQFHASFIGVPTVDDACGIAEECLREGIQMIDLCSGFTELDAMLVYEAVGHAVKVSYAGLNSQEWGESYGNPEKSPST